MSNEGLTKKNIKLYGLESTAGFKLKMDFKTFGEDYVAGAKDVDKVKDPPSVYIDYVENEICRMRGKSRIVYIGKTKQQLQARYNTFPNDYKYDVNKTFYTASPFTSGCKYRVYLFEPQDKANAYVIWCKESNWCKVSKKRPSIEEWLESMLLGIYFRVHSELPPKNSTWKFTEDVLKFLEPNKNWYGFDQNELNPFEND